MIFVAMKGDYFLLLSHLPPVMSEMSMNAIAIQENTVWSVTNPIVRNAMPRMRKIVEERFDIIRQLYILL